MMRFTCSEAYETLLSEYRYGLNGEKSALASQLAAEIFAKDKKGQWAATDPKEKRRKKKDYIPIAQRRVPTLDAGGEYLAAVTSALIVVLTAVSHIFRYS